jgi:hypothetical protein
MEHYFIDYYRDRDPQVSQLTIDDLRASRFYLVNPAPIPADESTAHLRLDEELGLSRDQSLRDQSRQSERVERSLTTDRLASRLLRTDGPNRQSCA